MLMTGIARLGSAPSVRYMPDGTAVMEVSAVFNHGKKGPDGKRAAQWVKATMWGARCEKLAPYLNKGDQIHLVLSEPHIETFEKKDGTGQGFVLRAKLTDLELLATVDRESPDETARGAVTATKAPDKATSPGPFDELADDIPF